MTIPIVFSLLGNPFFWCSLLAIYPTEASCAFEEHIWAGRKRGMSKMLHFYAFALLQQKNKSENFNSKLPS